MGWDPLCRESRVARACGHGSAAHGRNPSSSPNGALVACTKSSVELECARMRVRVAAGGGAAAGGAASVSGRAPRAALRHQHKAYPLGFDLYTCEARRLGPTVPRLKAATS